MKFEQILELVKTLSDSKVTTFKYEEGDTKIMMKVGEEYVIQSPLYSQAGGIALPSASVYEQGGSTIQGTVISGESLTSVKEEVELPESKKLAEGNVVKCPLVGTFYAASSEESDDFVKLGDKVEKGQTLAIVEAMKLMNEIDTEFAGEITEILVENGQKVEYGQPLFVVKSV